MSNWQNRLDLKDLWKARDEGKLTIQQLGKEVAKRIRKLRCYNEYEDELEDIAVDFEMADTVKDFDYILNSLYDWADTPLPTPAGQMQKKLCWVATII